jgi:outer membrane protein OmpA-like peptidoglycan-associated protein
LLTLVTSESMNPFEFARPIVTTVFLFSVLAVFSQSILDQKVTKKAKISNEKDINSPNMESSPCFAGDKIVYVFTGPKGKLFDSQTGDAFFDLGFATVHQNNALSEKGMYDKLINSEYHEGPASYNAAENTLFFTRTLREKRFFKGGEADTFYLRILAANLNMAKPEVKQIPLQAGNYSVCHPTLSTSGSTLIFSSNQPGGKGKMDLYTAYYNGTEWSGVLSLGPDINGPYNEVFPTLVNDSLLFFASDRPGGPGGLDLYVSRLQDGYWSVPEILTSPFNSPYDDLGLIVRPSGKSGYFSSNRPGGLGKDDIYRWECAAPIFHDAAAKKEELTIFALDKLTLEPLEGAQIKISPLATDINQFTLSDFNINVLNSQESGELILRLSTSKLTALPLFTTDPQGKSTSSLHSIRQYLISITRQGYSETSLLFDFQVLGDTVNVLLEPQDSAEEEVSFEDETEDEEDIIEAGPGTEKVKLMILDNIYFEYNSSQIMAGAASELDTLASWLTAQPDKRIRLESHTDSRGSTEYNLQLSIDRAEAGRKYLKAAGIDENRIEIKGLGESELRNKCKNGIPCTEKQHRFNRRTEVILLN